MQRATMLLLLVASALGCTPPAADPKCESLIDYALVVDNSASVINVTDQITTFLQNFVSEFDLGRVKFSVVSFGYTVETLAPLSSDAATINAAISNRGNQGGSTNIAAALYAGRDALTGSGARDGANKVMMLLTDGADTVSGDAVAIQRASQVKALPLKLFAVGFGDAEVATLQAMASEPAASYSFMGNDINSVIGQIDTLASTACERRAPQPRLPTPAFSCRSAPDLRQSFTTAWARQQARASATRAWSSTTARRRRATAPPSRLCSCTARVSPTRAASCAAGWSTRQGRPTR